MLKRSSLVTRQLGSVAETCQHPLAVRHDESRSSAHVSWKVGKKKRLDKGQGPTVRTGPLARLEAALFVARDPVTSRRLAQLASLPDGTRARSLANQLRKIYDLRGTPFQIEEVAGGFQLLSRRKYAQWIRRMEHPVSEIRLSTPASETLAVVAYRQPVLRAEIEAIRGVQCGEILRQLMERGLSANHGSFSRSRSTVRLWNHAPILTGVRFASLGRIASSRGIEFGRDCFI